jgi:hypothetical protein
MTNGHLADQLTDRHSIVTMRHKRSLVSYKHIYTVLLENAHWNQRDTKNISIGIIFGIGYLIPERLFIIKINKKYNSERNYLNKTASKV